MYTESNINPYIRSTVYPRGVTSHSFHSDGQQSLSRQKIRDENLKAHPPPGFAERDPQIRDRIEPSRIDPPPYFLLKNYHRSRVPDALNTYPVHACVHSIRVLHGKRYQRISEYRNLSVPRASPRTYYYDDDDDDERSSRPTYVLYFFSISAIQTSALWRASHETLFRSILSFGSWYPWKSSNEGKLK